jgi:hypothetical protein
MAAIIFMIQGTRKYGDTYMTLMRPNNVTKVP